MCERVGPKDYRAGFAVVDHQMRNDGLFLLHTIGTDLSVQRNEAFTQLREYRTFR